MQMLRTCPRTTPTRSVSEDESRATCVLAHASGWCCSKHGVILGNVLRGNPAPTPFERVFAWNGKRTRRSRSNVGDFARRAISETRQFRQREVVAMRCRDIGQNQVGRSGTDPAWRFTRDVDAAPLCVDTGRIVRNGSAITSRGRSPYPLVRTSRNRHRLLRPDQGVRTTSPKFGKLLRSRS